MWLVLGLVLVVLWLATVIALVWAVGALMRSWRRARTRLSLDDVAETIPYEDLHPVASYLYGMCGVPGLVVSDFAYAAAVWLVAGELPLPDGALRLARDDRAGLPPPYYLRPAVAEPPSLF